MDTLIMARQEREENGPWEAEISYGGEADLHRHLIVCSKNPGHLNFIPVDLFDVDSLPSGCQDKLLVEMIKAVLDLTVRVSVKFVSDERPAFFPGSDKPYPCYKNKGKGMIRVGTGWVWEVSIYPDKDDNSITTCECKECLNSPTPKTQFAHMYILTAAHVVYDDLEAADTTCHLFFDRGSKLDVCEGVISLTGMSEVKCDIADDWCNMVHATHDIDLAQRIAKMVSHRENLEEEVKARNNERNNPSPTTAEQNLKSDTESECYSVQPISENPLQNLTIIVSHPHGCSKQVSVGYCTDKDEREDNHNQYTYSTATCPGSSGARVCVMGEGKLYYTHVHSGNCEGNNELNFSSWT